MQSQKRRPDPNVEEPIDESTIDRLLLSPSQAFEIGQKLPAANRAQIAKFCYQRVHMWELGLRLAGTCDLATLAMAFGQGAETIFEQSRNIEQTLDAHGNTEKSSKQAPVTLAGPDLK